MMNHKPPDNYRRAIITLVISSVTDLASAQQRMRLLVFSRVCMRHLDQCSNDHGDGTTAEDGEHENGHCYQQHHRQSMQHQQKKKGRGEEEEDESNSEQSQAMLSFLIRWRESDTKTHHEESQKGSSSASSSSSSSSSSATPIIRPPPPSLVRLIIALHRGKNRLVMREWKQGACWWNLNTNSDLSSSSSSSSSSCSCMTTNNNVKHDDAVEEEKKGPTTPILRGSAHYNSMSDASNPSCVAPSYEAKEMATLQTTLSMARAEVAGYRLSKLAMDCYHDNFQQQPDTTMMDSCNSNYVSGDGDSTCIDATHHRIKNCTDPTITMQHQKNDSCRKGNSSREQRAVVYMPEVLHFSHDDNDDNDLTLVGNLGLSMQQPDDDTNNDGSRCLNNYELDNTPWALLSYFDNETKDIDDDDDDMSEFLQSKLNMDNCLDMDLDWGDGIHSKDQRSTGSGGLENDQLHQSTTAATTSTQGGGERDPCHHYASIMIKVRREFGFDEPHPRHGRVPMGECLEYGMMILRDVIMPIQTSFFAWRAELDNMVDSECDDESSRAILRNHLMSVGWSENSKQRANGTTSAKPFQYHDMIEVYRGALHRLSLARGMPQTNGRTDQRINMLLQMLGECVDALNCEWKEHGGRPPPLPPVLCHMDLQPQNLAFWRERCKSNGLSHGTTADEHVSNSPGKNNQPPTNPVTNDRSVALVMDWEEACYADPRFELLLVCRKVLANREQSEQLWRSYSNRVRQLAAGRLSPSSQGSSDEKSTVCRWEVGPLEPWLKLEAVHSLCTLLLQAMDLLGGGRSPWESKPELWGKIDRERQRLVRMGWSFCDCSGEMKE